MPAWRRCRARTSRPIIDVPLPIIDDSNLDSYLARAKDFAADGYIYSPYDTKLFDELIAKSLKK